MQDFQNKIISPNGNFIINNKFLFIIVLLTLISFLKIYLYLGNSDIQLSRTTYDAGPVATGHFFHSPQNFSNDIEMLLSYRQWMPSLMFNSLVGLNYFFQISPELTGLIYTYLQNVLLIIAVFYLSYQLTKNLSASVCSALYVLGFNPQFHNLSFYGELLWMPYAGHLAMPFFLFSINSILKEKLKIGFILLFLGGCIHYLLGLQMICFLGVYFLISNYFENQKLILNKAFISKMIYLFIIACFFIVIPKLFILGIKPIEANQTLDLISGVVHQVPWLLGWELYSQKIAAFAIKILLAAIIIYFFKDKFESRNKVLLLSAFISCAFLGLVNIFGFFFKSNLLLQISGLRFSVFLILLSLPFIFYFIFLPVKKMDLNFKNRIYNILFLILGTLIAFKLFVTTDSLDRKMQTISLLILCSLFVFKFLFKKSNFIKLVLIGFSIFVSIYFILNSLKTFTDQINYTQESILWISLVFVVLTLLFSNYKIFVFSASLPIFFALVFFTAADSYKYGKESTSGNWKEIYEAQLWARDNSPEGSHFILMDLLSPFQSWRSLTRRGVVSQAMPYGNQYFYSEEMKVYSDELSVFYGLENPKKYFVFNEAHENIQRLKMYDAFANLSESRIIEFANKFGGEYIVRKALEKKLNFQIAYQNSYVVIYKIPKNSF